MGKEILKDVYIWGRGGCFFPQLKLEACKKQQRCPCHGTEESPDKCAQFYRTPASDKAILWQWRITASPLHNHVSTPAKSGTLSKPQKWPNFSQSWPILNVECCFTSKWGFSISPSTWWYYTPTSPKLPKTSPNPFISLFRHLLTEILPDFQGIWVINQFIQMCVPSGLWLKGWNTW